MWISDNFFPFENRTSNGHKTSPLLRNHPAFEHFGVVQSVSMKQNLVFVSFEKWYWELASHTPTLCHDPNKWTAFDLVSIDCVAFESFYRGHQSRDNLKSKSKQLKMIHINVGIPQINRFNWTETNIIVAHLLWCAS